VVYYANYLKFMERARTEWLRSLGFEQDILRDQEGALFAVSRVSLDLRRPARPAPAGPFQRCASGQRAGEKAGQGEPDPRAGDQGGI